MLAYPKISIVTICLNSDQYLEAAMRSILDQEYPNLEYIVIDGGSSDDSIEIIKRYESRLAYWVSEPDEGPVHALQKGLAKATGEIMAWLNADDLHHHNSLFAVAEIFQQHKNVKWIMGTPTWLNRRSLWVQNNYNSEWEKIKYRYFNNENMQRQLVWWSKHRYYCGNFMAIQQESTFWRRELWEKAGGTLDTQFKLAYDMELWCRFFRHEKLYTVPIFLAGFRFRFGGQLSIVNRQSYIKECQTAREREWDRLSLLQKANSTLCCFLGNILKIGIYLHLPLAKMAYCWVVGVPRLTAEFKKNPLVYKQV
jgi:glycosyltransferase involved in cell wall biosynthesis